MNVKVIAIVGPTAAGKSELAVRLAKKFNGEIISADSRQVYRGLYIGSGKVEGRWRRIPSNIQCSPKTLNVGRVKASKSYEVQPHKIFIYKNIPHYCIDYVSPKKRYTVVDFQHCAYEAIEDIYKRGKIPFLVGGTGLYIDAVLNNTQFPSAPANPALRRRLERLPVKKLFAMLKKKDLHRAAAIDPRNKRRLIRALEIIEKTGTPVPDSVWDNDYEKLRSQENVVILLGIKKTKNALQRAIAARIRVMLKRGLIAETKKLHAAPPTGGGLSWKRINEFGFEYRLPALYLQKKITRKELEERLIKENWRYAKRQMTWWKRNKQIHWISSFGEACAIIAYEQFNKLKKYLQD